MPNLAGLFKVLCDSLFTNADVILNYTIVCFFLSWWQIRGLDVHSMVYQNSFLDKEPPRKLMKMLLLR